MEQVKFKRAEIICALIVSVIAPMLHFLYAWSGDALFVGIFAAVNESVWEHTKLVYFAILFVSVVEYFVIKPDFKRFFIAKAVALAASIAIMVCTFYTYTGMFGIESLAVDIVLTFVIVILSYVISYKMYRSKMNLERYFGWFLALFIAVFLMEILFTLFPPHIPLFMDTESMLYGMA